MKLFLPLFLFLSSACALGAADRPRPDGARLGVHQIRCRRPPTDIDGSGASVSVVPLPRDLIAVGERGAFNWDPGLDERIVIDGRDLERQVAADCSRLLNAGPGSPAFELQFTEIATSLDRGGFFSLRGTITARMAIRARVAGRDPDGPWPWTFETSGQKRVAYLQVGDYVDALDEAYCHLLGDIARRSGEVDAALRTLAGMAGGQ